MSRRRRPLCLGLLILAASIALSSAQSRRTWQCEKVSIELCRNMGYNVTRMPNLIGHESQREAEAQLKQFLPLIQYGCAKQHLTFFLCSAYAPLCTEKLDVVITSCRPLCEYVRTSCLPVLTEFGIPWPHPLNCSRFLPTNNEKHMCMPGPNFTEQPTSVDPGRVLPNDTANSPDLKKKGSEQCRRFKNSENYYYVRSTESCAVRCNEEGIFKNSDKKTIELWMTIWSILCFLSTLVTLSTFIIDTTRFKYPERAIIWLALCYNFYSISFIIRLAAGRSAVSCDVDPATNVRFHIQDGLRNTGCAVIFLIQYFFNMAATIWWVVLALIWFLAAGMKWGYEAIGSYANLFHVIAWILPCIKTIFILITRKVDGDELTGVCYVGNQDLIALAAFVLGPQFTYLIIGTLFLIAGFVALFRVRSTVQRTNQAKTDKLERLIVRIGIFSVLSTIPATAVIACYFYEYANKEYWYYGKRDEAVAEPNFSIFVIKLFMSLFVGIISGMWVWTPKTVKSWKKFYYKMRGKRPPRRAPKPANPNETTV
ncbi:frizzled-4-like [Actinia tenebrosa]|uniref:Frizzled-4-like n=1 Tax=Actinia tenebrosa TaxID=6105 RepID=A0A6P8IVP5_ACTTE|nr:frizzled-4-like [Actinia tenebrosa]